MQSGEKPPSGLILLLHFRDRDEKQYGMITKAFFRRNWPELHLQEAQYCWHGLQLHTIDPLKGIGLEIKAWLKPAETPKVLVMLKNCIWCARAAKGGGWNMLRVHSKLQD